MKPCQAQSRLDSTVQNNITVNLQVGYGDWDNGLMTGLVSSAVGADMNGVYISYSTLRAALASRDFHARSDVRQLAAEYVLRQRGISFYVPSAIEKALGMIAPTASAIDGAVGIGTQPASDLVGAALHEFTHALGQETGTGPFMSPGNYLFSSGSTAPAA